MSDWIDRKQEIAQSTSKLPVIPPTPTPAKNKISAPVVAADIPVAIPVAIPVSTPEKVYRHGQRAESRATAAATLPTNAAAVNPPTASPIAPANPANYAKPTKPGKRKQRAQPQSPTTIWPLVNLDSKDEPAEKAFEITKFSYVYGMPSWLVSFILHLALLLLLALLSFGNPHGANILSLEMADPNSVDDIQMFEAVVEFSSDQLDEQSPELESFEEEKLSMESDVELAKALMADLKSGLDNSSGDDSKQMDNVAKLSRGDGKSVKFFGAGAEGTKFIFVIDCSGSMSSEYRWETACRELKYAIEGLTAKQMYYVFLYNHDTFGMSDKTPKLVRANAANKKKTFEWIDEKYPYGDTMPWKSLRTSLELKPDAIFLLSDGELRDNSVRLLKTFNIDRDEDRYTLGKYKIPIHTIFLGNGMGDKTMRNIADQNNGSFTEVAN